MGDIFVTYNGTTLSPTPVVSQALSFVDYGNRWGNVNQITLNGQLTGLKSPNDYGILTGIFNSQFGTLQVLDNATPIYNWANIVVDEISFGANPWFSGGLTSYSVRMRAFAMPSGVTDPVNEYSFQQGEDSIVTVTHRMSARGIKTVTGAFQNAIAFVKNVTGKNPFAPAFIPSGSPILMSVTENIDRVAAIYGVTETWKFNTGSSNPWVETFTVNLNDSVDNTYIMVDAELKLQGSPVNNNIPQIESQLPNIKTRVADLGYSTALMAQNTFGVVRDTGAANVTIKASYVSGYSNEDLTGFLDYAVSLDQDLVMPKENWKIEGDFTCRGPLDYRATQLAAFKSTYGNNWRGYLLGLISGSPLFTDYHSAPNLFPWDSTLEVQENTSLATLKLSLSTSDGTHPSGYVNPHYTLEVEPSKWGFNLLPSCNIEGHYVLQDLQMSTQAKLNLSLTAESANPGQAGFTGLMTSFANVYVGTSSQVTAENITTGLADISYNKQWLGADNVGTGFLYTKVFGSVASSYVRQPGFDFGY